MGTDNDWIPPVPSFDDGRDRNIRVGQARTLGYRVKSGAAEYVVARSSLLGRKQAAVFPATADGWTAAWRLFKSEDPGAATSFADELLELQRRRQAEDPETQAAFAVHEATERRRVLAARRALRSRPKLAVITGCQIQGGFGFDDLETGEMTDLYFDDRCLVITEADSPMQLAEMAYADIVALQVDGPGTRTTGGGFVGGGFGVKGAAEGMLMAAVLNQLTSRTTTTTVIEVQDRDRDIIWTNGSKTPVEVSYLLKPVYAKLRLAQAGSTTQAPAERRPQRSADDVVAQLEKLADLRRAGVLTDAEFETAKARVLG